MAVFETQNLPNLISRKIWVAKKFLIFHTVRQMSYFFGQSTKDGIFGCTFESFCVKRIESKNASPSKWFEPLNVFLTFFSEKYVQCHFCKQHCIIKHFLVYVVASKNLSSAVLPTPQIKSKKWLPKIVKYRQLIGCKLCGNLGIFLLLRFYAKSNLVCFESQMLPFWHF